MERAQSECEKISDGSVGSYKMSKFLEPPSFIGENKNFETYQKDLKRWTMLTTIEVDKQALMVVHFLDGHVSGIKEKIDESMDEKVLASKEGIQALLTFFEEIYKKDSLADGYEKYISFEKLKRSPNTSMYDFIPEWNAAYKKAVNVGCQLSDKVLAFKLLNAANLSNIERNLVLTGVNYEAKDLKNQMEAALKKFVGRSALSGGVERTEDSTFLTEDNFEQVLVAKGWKKPNKKKRNASPAKMEENKKKNWVGKDGKVAKCFKCKCDHENECNCPCTFHLANMCPNKKPELQASTSRAPDLGLYMQANFLTYTTDEVEDNTVDNVVLFVVEEGEESATEEVVDCASPGVEELTQ